LTSNWQNRMSFPISFAPQPTQCSRSDSRPQFAVTGSELAYPAMYSWVPDFCLDPKKFNLGYVALSEPQARNDLVKTGPGGLNAILTTQPVTNSNRPVVHAPVAVTGFAVTFLIDDANNQQVLSLNLTPLLLAKMITDSYRGYQPTEPALQGNPQTLFNDPEFLSVNPNFAVPDPSVNWLSELNMIMLGGGDQSDVIWALTSYINADPEARAWLDGAPDIYGGMVVNPNYRGYTLPQLATDLRDLYKEPANGNVNPDCAKQDPTPNQLLLSQPEQSLKDAATSELSGLAQGSFNCSSSDGAVFLWGKNKTPQQAGARALLALTSVPFAQLYGLPTASLQVHELAGGKRFFVAPFGQNQDPGPMTAALAFSNQDKATGVLSLDYQHLAINAYPGTMPVYAVVPTAGLDAATAENYAQWLTFAVTDGQTPGIDLGQLPPGYAPLTGALGPMADYTVQAAKAVAHQTGQVPTPPPNLGGRIAAALGVTPVNGLLSVGGTGVHTGNGTTVVTGTSTAASPTSTTGGVATAGRPRTVALTRGTGSWLAAWGLPILLGVGCLAGLSVLLARVISQTGHPARVALVRLGSRLVALLPRRSA
jgi:hypothetical protein